MVQSVLKTSYQRFFILNLNKFPLPPPFPITQFRILFKFSDPDSWVQTLELSWVPTLFPVLDICRIYQNLATQILESISKI